MKEHRNIDGRSEKLNFDRIVVINSQDLPPIRSSYVCEDCDYKWGKDIPVSLEDNYSEAMEIKLNDERVSCPICGSHRTNRYEG